MKGRTRSFFEDLFVLLVVVAVIGSGYYLFFSNDGDEVKSVSNDQTVKTVQVVQDTKSSKEEETKEPARLQTQSLQNESIKEQKQLPKDDTVIQSEKYTKKKVLQNKDETQKQVQKVDPKRIAHLVKNVDLKALQKFKQDVKQAMKNEIILDKTKDFEAQSFSVRVTVLKNGEYEQLVYTGGDQESFEKNKEKILQVFPLNIGSDIVQDFPRYLRYTFKFNNNDN